MENHQTVLTLMPRFADEPGLQQNSVAQDSFPSCEITKTFMTFPFLLTGKRVTDLKLIMQFLIA